MIIIIITGGEKKLQDIHITKQARKVHLQNGMSRCLSIHIHKLWEMLGSNNGAFERVEVEEWWTEEYVYCILCLAGWSG